MKLFERVRPPFDEKFVPPAKALWPEFNWLTPGADKAML
jgi:hypothetical protein